jgi:hypothetical protein
MTKTKKTKNAPSVNRPIQDNLYPSYVPAVSIEEITNQFLSKQKSKKKNDGENSVIPDFALSIRMICHNYQNQSFNFNNVLELTSHLGSNSEDLIPLWHDWVKAMQEHRRLKVINIVGIPQYTFQ